MTTMFMTMTSPLGPLHLYARTDELVGVWMRAEPLPDAVPGRSRVLERTAEQLAEYFAGKRREFDLPLAPRGTGFQEMVWRALLMIPFGETRSYGEIARAIGRPSASRAVGAANGRNPISIIVPCHRVIGTSGELTGYGGGLDNKRWLLDHESRNHALPVAPSVTRPGSSSSTSTMMR
jgi:methylated-DNA-[protein]-cysteine S-methyltransferase